MKHFNQVLCDRKECKDMNQICTLIKRLNEKQKVNKTVEKKMLQLERKKFPKG